MTTRQNPPPTAWCPECRARRGVEDTHDEGEMTRRGETIYLVTDLSCGHALQSAPRIYAPAPGAPYAGPGRAVAASHHPGDLMDAARRQAALDRESWADQ